MIILLFVGAAIAAITNLKFSAASTPAVSLAPPRYNHAAVGVRAADGEPYIVVVGGRETSNDDTLMNTIGAENQFLNSDSVGKNAI